MHVSVLLLVFASLSQDGCHGSKHHTLAQYCPKQETRGGYKREHLPLMSSLQEKKIFPRSLIKTSPLCLIGKN